ncbi:hypothetical protein HYU93_02800 [Candidatus Daviesbacteria bacterium]|nr:hypothetical protein [Candidatus Daviesbacteria bacterium]
MATRVEFAPSTSKPVELAGYHKQRSLRWGLAVGLIIVGSSLALLPQMSNPGMGLGLSLILGLTAGIIISRSIKANEPK